MSGAEQVCDIWDGNSLGLDGSRVIDREVYRDQAIFAAEQEQLFTRTWQWVGHESEVREFGDYLTVRIAGRPVVVARGEEGRLNAFYNSCTHRGAILAHGTKGNCRGSFTCMYHAWSFDTSGKLESAPQSEAYGDELKKGSYDSPKIRLDVFCGNIFINIDGKAPPLEDYLGESKEYIEESTGGREVLGRVRWKLEGNWKLWHENFRDNYHPMFTHQFLTFLYQGVKADGVNRDLGNGHSHMKFPSQGSGDSYAKFIKRLTGRPYDSKLSVSAREAHAGHVVMAVFPNLDFQYGYGGAAHHSPYCVLQIVRPISVSEAVVEIVAFGSIGEPEKVRQERLDTILGIQTSSGKVSADDTEAARRCTIGFGAADVMRWSNIGRGQEPGKLGAKSDEYSLRAFYSEYKKYMNGALKSGQEI